MNWRLICIVGCLLLTLSACGRNVPRLEPLRFGGGSGGVTFGSTVDVSTNCAEIGEIVTFTVTLQNDTKTSVMLTGTPLMDITLQPARWLRRDRMPIERWSDTYQYPANLNPVLTPGDKRTYTWNWMANRRFTQQGPNDNNVLITFTMGRVSMDRAGIPAGSSTAYMGVSTLSTDAGVWPCTQLRS